MPYTHIILWDSTAALDVQQCSYDNNNNSNVHYTECLNHSPFDINTLFDIRMVTN